MIGSKDEIFPINIRVDFSEKPIEDCQKPLKSIKKCMIIILQGQETHQKYHHKMTG